MPNKLPDWFPGQESSDNNSQDGVTQQPTSTGSSNLPSWFPSASPLFSPKSYVSYSSNGYIDFATTANNIKDFIKANGVEQNVDPYSFYNIFNDPEIAPNISAYSRGKLSNTFKNYLTNAFRDVNYESKQFKVPIPESFKPYPTFTEEDLLATDYNAPNMITDDRTLYGLKNYDEYPSFDAYMKAYVAADQKKNNNPIKLTNGQYQKKYALDDITNAFGFFGSYLGDTQEEKDESMNAIIAFALGSYDLSDPEFAPIWEKIKKIPNRAEAIRNLRTIINDMPTLMDLSNDPEIADVAKANTNYKVAQTNLLGTGVFESKEEFDTFMFKYASGQMSSAELCTMYAQRVMNLPEDQQAKAIAYVQDLFYASDRASMLESFFDLEPVGNKDEQLKDNAWLAKAYGDEASAFTTMFFNMINQINTNGQTVEGFKTPADILNYVKKVKNSIYGDAQIIDESQWERGTSGYAANEEYTKWITENKPKSQADMINAPSQMKQTFTADPNGYYYRNKETGEILSSGQYSDRLSNRPPTILEATMGFLNSGEHIVGKALEHEATTMTRTIQKTYQDISSNYGVDVAEEFVKYFDKMWTKEKIFNTSELSYVVPNDMAKELGFAEDINIIAGQNEVEPIEYLQAIENKLGIKFDIDNFLLGIKQSKDDSTVFNDFTLDVRKQSDFSSALTSFKQLDLMTNGENINKMVQQRLDSKGIDPNSEEYKNSDEYRFINGGMNQDQKAQWLAAQEWYISLGASILLDPMNVLDAPVKVGLGTIKKLAGSVIKAPKYAEIIANGIDTVSDVTKIMNDSGINFSDISMVAKGSIDDVGEKIVSKLKDYGIPEDVVASIPKKTLRNIDSLNDFIVKKTATLSLTAKEMEELKGVAKSVSDMSTAEFIVEKARKLQGDPTVGAEGTLLSKKTYENIAKKYADSTFLKGLNSKFIDPVRDFKFRVFGGKMSKEMIAASKSVNEGHKILAMSYVKQIKERTTAIAMSNLAHQAKGLSKVLNKDKAFVDRFKQFFAMKNESIEDVLLNHLKGNIDLNLGKFVSREKQLIEKELSKLYKEEIKEVSKILNYKDLNKVQQGILKSAAAKFQFIQSFDFQENLLKNGFNYSKVQHILSNNQQITAFKLSQMSVEDIAYKFGYLFDVDVLEEAIDDSVVAGISSNINKIVMATKLKTAANSTMMALQAVNPNTIKYLTGYGFYDLTSINVKKFFDASLGKVIKQTGKNGEKFTREVYTGYFSKMLDSGSDKWKKEFYLMLMAAGDNKLDEVIKTFDPSLNIGKLIDQYDEVIELLEKQDKLGSFLDAVANDAYTRTKQLVNDAFVENADGTLSDTTQMASKTQQDVYRRLLSITDPMSANKDLSGLTSYDIRMAILDEYDQRNLIEHMDTEEYESYLNTISANRLNNSIVSPLSPMGTNEIEQNIKDIVDKNVVLKTKQINKEEIDELFNPTMVGNKIDINTHADFVKNKLPGFMEDAEIKAGHVPENILQVSNVKKNVYLARLSNISGLELSVEYANHLIADNAFANARKIVLDRAKFLKETDFIKMVESVKAKGISASEYIDNLLRAKIGAPVTYEGKLLFDEIVHDVMLGRTNHALSLFDAYSKMEGATKMDKVIAFLNKNFPYAVSSKTYSSSIKAGHIASSDWIKPLQITKAKHSLEAAGDTVENSFYDYLIFGNNGSPVKSARYNNAITQKKIISLLAQKRSSKYFKQISLSDLLDSTKSAKPLISAAEFENLPTVRKIRETKNLSSEKIYELFEKTSVADFSPEDINSLSMDSMHKLTNSMQKTSDYVKQARDIFDGSDSYRYEKFVGVYGVFERVSRGNVEFVIPEYVSKIDNAVEKLPVDRPQNVYNINETQKAINVSKPHLDGDIVKNRDSIAAIGSIDVVKPSEDLVNVVSPSTGRKSTTKLSSEAAYYAKKVKTAMDNILEKYGINTKTFYDDLRKASHKQRVDILRPVLNSISENNDNAKYLLWFTKQLNVLESKMSKAALNGSNIYYLAASYADELMDISNSAVRQGNIERFATTLRHKAFIDNDFLNDDIFLGNSVADSFGKFVSPEPLNMENKLIKGDYTDTKTGVARGAKSDSIEYYSAADDIDNIDIIQRSLEEAEDLYSPAKLADHRRLFEKLLKAKTWKDAREIKAQILSGLRDINSRSVDYVPVQYEPLKFYNGLQSTYQPVYLAAIVDHILNSEDKELIKSLLDKKNNNLLSKMSTFSDEDILKWAQNATTREKSFVVDLYRKSDLSLFEKDGIKIHGYMPPSGNMKKFFKQNLLLGEEDDILNINKQILYDNQSKAYSMIDNLNVMDKADLFEEYTELLKQSDDIAEDTVSMMFYQSKMQKFLDKLDAETLKYNQEDIIRNLSERYKALVNGKTTKEEFVNKYNAIITEASKLNNVDLNRIFAQNIDDISPVKISDFKANAALGDNVFEDGVLHSDGMQVNKTSENIDVLYDKEQENIINKALNATPFQVKHADKVFEDGTGKIQYYDFVMDDGYRFRVDASFVDNGSAEEIITKIRDGLKPRGMFTEYIKNSNIITVIPKKSFTKDFRGLNILKDGLIVIENPETIKDGIDLILHEFGENKGVLQAVAGKPYNQMDILYSKVADLIDNSIKFDMSNWYNKYGQMNNVADVIARNDKLMKLSKTDVIAALNKYRLNPMTLSDHTQVLPEILRYFEGTQDVAADSLAATMRSNFPATYNQIKKLVFENKILMKKSTNKAIEQSYDFVTSVDKEINGMMRKINDGLAAVPSALDSFIDVGANIYERRSKMLTLQNTMQSLEHGYIAEEFMDYLVNDLNAPDWMRKNAKNISDAIMNPHAHTTLTARQKVIYDALLEKFHSIGVSEGMLEPNTKKWLNSYLIDIADPEAFITRKAVKLNLLPNDIQKNIYKIDDFCYKKGLGKGYFQRSMVNLYVLKAMNREKFLFEKEIASNVLEEFGYKATISDLLDPVKNKDAFKKAKILFPSYKDSDFMVVTMNEATEIFDVSKKQKITLDSLKNSKQYLETVHPGITSSSEFKIYEEALNRDTVKIQTIADFMNSNKAGAAHLIKSEGDAYVIPKQLMNIFTDYAEKQKNQVMDIIGKSTHKALKFYDTVLSVFKRQATLINPGFYVTNFIGNMVNGYLGAGVRIFNPKRQAEAIKLSLMCMINPEGKLKDVIKGFKVRGMGIDWWNKQLHMYNVVSHSIFDDNMISGYESAIKAAFETGNWRSVKSFMKRNFIDLNPLASVNMFLENQTRIASFLSHLDDGMSGLEAAELTNKFLFDYDDLNGFERNVMKRIFPFYTWVRKNTALQIRMLYENPARLNHYYDVYRNLSRNLSAGQPPEDPRMQYLKPDYAYATGIYMGRTEDNKHRYTNIQFPPLEPFKWLNSIDNAIKTGNPFNAISSNFSPVFQVMPELLLNKRLDFGEMKDLTNMSMTDNQAWQARWQLIQDRIFPIIKAYGTPEQAAKTLRLIKEYEINPLQLQAVLYKALTEVWTTAGNRNALYKTVDRLNNKEYNKVIAEKIGIELDKLFSGGN